MLDLLIENIKVLRTLLGQRIGHFFSSELGEFRSDPRWLLKDECLYTSVIEGDPRDVAEAITIGDNEVEFTENENATELHRGGSGRSHDLQGAASSGGGCCPPVVDQYTWLALISGIALATYFLRIAVTTNIMGRRRRKREGAENFLLSGLYCLSFCSLINYLKQKLFVHCNILTL